MIGQSKTIVKQNLIFIIMKTKSLFVSIFVLTLFVSCGENAVGLSKNPPKHLHFFVQQKQDNNASIIMQ